MKHNITIHLTAREVQAALVEYCRSLSGSLGHDLGHTGTLLLGAELKGELQFPTEVIATLTFAETDDSAESK